MPEHKKGLIQPQDQARQTDKSNMLLVDHIRAPHKKELTLMLLLRSPSGITENQVLRAVRISNARNYFTEVERKLGIVLGRLELENPDGIGAHFKYWITCRDDALKVANHINKMRVRRKDEPLSISEIDYLISQYPEVPEQAA